MDDKLFEQGLETIRQRVELLSQRLPTYTEQQPSAQLFTETFEELFTTLKELGVAATELRQQNDELIAIRQVLRLSEQESRAIFELNAVGLAQADPTTGRFVRVNRKLCDISGYSEAELLGMTYSQLTHPDDREVDTARFQAAVRGETGGWRSEKRYIRKDGACIWVEVVGTIIYDAAGRPLRSVGVIQDITERKGAEEALRENERRLQQAQELLETVTAGTGVIIATQDTNFCYTYFNRAYQEEMKQLTGQDIHVGASMVEAFAHLPEQQKVAVAEWSQVMRGESTSKTIEFGDPGRHRRVYDVLHTPIRDAAGNIVGAGEVAYDVTEKMQTERALRESEERYRALFNGMTEGFALHEIICDEQGHPCDYRFLEINPSFERLTSLKREDVVGKLVSEVLPNNEPHWVKTYGKVALTGESVHFENYSSALDRHYEVFAYCPAPRQFAVLFLDITERKQAVEEIESLARFPAENPSPILRLSQDGVILYANEASQALLREWGCGIADPAPPAWRDRVAEALASRATKTIDVQCDGQVYSFVIVPIAEAGYVNLYGQNITERKRVEEIIQLRLRLFEFAAMHSLTELMQKALDEIGRITGSPIGFYHFVEADQKTLSLQAWSTRTLQEFCKAEGRGLHYNLDEAGVWVDCVYQRKPVIHNNYASLPHRKGMPAGHAEVIRELVVPIMREGRVVSILGVGNKPSDYDEKDVEFVFYIADVVWEIIERKRAEESLEHANVQLQAQNEELQVQAEELEAQSAELQTLADELQAQALQLEAEQARLRAIIDSTPEAILVADEYGQVVLANPAAKHLYPRVRGQENFAEITRYHQDHTPYDPDDLPLFRAAVHEETHRNIPMALLWPDGQWRNILASAVPIFDSHGQAHGAVGVYQDITELKQTEEALRVALEKYRVLFESFPMGITISDKTGKIVETNKEAERLLSVPQTVHNQRDIDSPEWQIIRPNGSPMPAEEFASVRALQENCLVDNVEMGIVREGDEITWINVTAAPIPLEGYGVAVAYGDITARRRAEEELRETRDYLDNLLTYANAPIIVWNPDFKITRFNGAFERLTGLKANDVYGKSLDILFPEDQKEEALGHIRRAGAGERWEVVEIPIRRIDGTVRTVLWNSATLYAADGATVVATIAQGQDITERKQAEAQIRAALAEKEVLLQEIHHRVKNNLQVLMHLIDMQIETIQNPQILQMFRALQQRIQTIALVHAKLYQAQDLGRVDFGDYLRSLTTYLYESLAGHRNVTLSVEADEVFINLNMANPCGLIVNELVTNALKYAFPAERRDARRREEGNEIRVGFRLEEGEYVLTVSDNGVGLPPGFDWRATESLGLKLVNILAEYQLRGHVEVDTGLDSTRPSSEPVAAAQEQAGPGEPGRRKGTTFTIRFAEKRK